MMMMMMIFNEQEKKMKKQNKTKEKIRYSNISPKSEKQNKRASIFGSTSQML